MRETIRRCAIIIACSAVLLGIAPRDGETLLYVFNGSGDGAFPYGGLLADAGGSLYGTTFGGGKFFAGTAFELAKSGSGGYVERVLHSFRGRKDGAGPQAALIADSAGALYGTTAFGGVGCPGRYGCGTVFRLTPHDSDYKERLLYSFTGGLDGKNPQGSLLADAAGNLYGTTASGGGSAECPSGCGTVFELSRQRGAYVESVLYAFQGGADGAYPVGGLIADAKGDLYGTTEDGGLAACMQGCGTVFELTATQGTYSKSILYTFSGGTDGAKPAAGLIADASGALFGTTEFGGKISGPCTGSYPGCGTVFSLAPKSGAYVESILHAFSVGDGAYPVAPLLAGRGGTLYGTTQGGGSYGFGGGTVFELTKSKRDYVESVLYSFAGQGGESGGLPLAGLIVDSDGVLFGTTSVGGNANPYCSENGGCGTVFQIQK